MVDWSNYEVELIVSDYFQMLTYELTGKEYKKSVHRRKLLPLLNKRSEGSVEFKHQNISAVLINLGQPYLRGYLPRFNYQKILEEIVIKYLYQNLQIEDHFRQFAESEVQTRLIVDFNKLVIEPPIFSYVSESVPIYHRNPIKVNYLEKEQNNRKLGLYGEELVVNYEKWMLQKKGKSNYSDQVRWISKEEGDGAGFDILSKNTNGTDKYIEVKTTKLGKETPFFFSRNELVFSLDHKKDFHLYRLFNFGNDAKMFTKNGSLDNICQSIPVTYKGFF